MQKPYSSIQEFEEGRSSLIQRQQSEFYHLSIESSLSLKYQVY